MNISRIELFSKIRQARLSRQASSDKTSWLCGDSIIEFYACSEFEVTLAEREAFTWGSVFR